VHRRTEQGTNTERPGRDGKMWKLNRISDGGFALRAEWMVIAAPSLARMAVAPLPSAASEARALIRAGGFKGRSTRALAPGFLQANLLVLSPRLAVDFITFALLNPRPLPLLDVVSNPGNAPLRLAPLADISRDIPLYSVYRRGRLVDQVVDPSRFWPKHGVGILTGCGSAAITKP